MFASLSNDRPPTPRQNHVTRVGNITSWGVSPEMQSHGYGLTSTDPYHAPPPYEELSGAVGGAPVQEVDCSGGVLFVKEADRKDSTGFKSAQNSPSIDSRFVKDQIKDANDKIASSNNEKHGTGGTEVVASKPPISISNAIPEVPVAAPLISMPAPEGGPIADTSIFEPGINNVNPPKKSILPDINLGTVSLLSGGVGQLLEASYDDTSLVPGRPDVIDALRLYQPGESCTDVDREQTMNNSSGEMLTHDETGNRNQNGTIDNRIKEDRNQKLNKTEDNGRRLSTGSSRKGSANSSGSSGGSRRSSTGRRNSARRGSRVAWQDGGQPEIYTERL